MPFQTTKQTAGSVRFGSGKIEVGDDVGSLVNLGIVNGVTYEETQDVTKLEYDNVSPEYILANQEANISGELVEIELSNLNEFRGGVDSYSTSDGSEETGYDYVISSGAWSLETFIPLDNQPASGLAANFTINSVTGGSDGEFVGGEGTDWHEVQDDDGRWGIVVDGDGTATTASQQLTINYDYTPAASKTLTSGGNTTISPKVVRITNTNEDDEVFRITLYKAYNQDGIGIELQADSSGEFATTPFNMMGVLDSDRTVGDQLVEIYDEQTS